MKEVTLSQILQAREEWAAQQRLILDTYRCPLICFTMNIAGPVKVSPLIVRGFREGIAQLEKSLPENCIRFHSAKEDVTGCGAMIAADLSAGKLKEICISIEESSPLGRLFDMDVLDTDGRKLDRPGQRGCIVCGAPGRACAARRVHSVMQLQEVTARILHTHFFPGDMAALAVRSLLEEVNITPKPGLVDRRNNGSHKDMNLSLFHASAYALEPYFRSCVEIGMKTAPVTPEETFELLRAAGLRAEQDMYRSTGGVNTHKGAVYTMGVLCGSLGRLWTPEKPVADARQILREAAKLVQKAVEEDFAHVSVFPTAGERLYQQYGLRGIRGEVADGLPSVANISLPVYRNCLRKGMSANDAGAVTLVHLIAGVRDTNLYHRGGEDGARYASEAASALLPEPDMAQIEALDDEFIRRNLSPGGCADLLAVTCFLHSLSEN